VRRVRQVTAESPRSTGSGPLSPSRTPFRAADATAAAGGEPAPNRRRAGCHRGAARARLHRLAIGR